MHAAKLLPIAFLSGLFLGAPAAAQMAPVVPTLTDGFASVVLRVRPTVVSITSRKIVRVPVFEAPSQFPFPFFGGPVPPRERRVLGQGSGVIVTADGFLLTNHHVVDSAEEVRVTLADRREFVAKVVGTDPPSDIAVIKIEADGLPFLDFGDSTRVRVGEFALALGSPFGLRESVTLGIISAIGRGDIGLVDYEDFVQTDAAIHPGNSGGPLVNARAELIGINTAMVTSGTGSGIGFAVPAKLARAVLDQIRTQGRVVRGWLGVSIQEVTPALAHVLGLKEVSGALVGDVLERSPAGRTGVKRGDVIVELDATPVDSSRELRMRIAAATPGSKVSLGLLRDGKRLHLVATLGEVPSEGLAPPPPKAAPGTFGLELAPLTPDFRLELGISARTQGVVVTAVLPGSRAAVAGLLRGDVVLEINRKAVTSEALARDLIQRAEKKPLLLLIHREGGTLYLLVESE